jgi:hypothetical protein
MRHAAPPPLRLRLRLPTSVAARSPPSSQNEPSWSVKWGSKRHETPIQVLAMPKLHSSQQMRYPGSTSTHATNSFQFQQLADMISAQSKILHERDAEISQLRTASEQLNSKINQQSAQKEIYRTTTKGWVIRNLKDENNAQRSRESSLLARVAMLNERLEAYETKFHGKDVDVPMLLIKLKEYVDRSQDLECQVRRLTNRKLNELVLLSRPRHHLQQVEEEDEEEVVDEEGGEEQQSESPQSICETRLCESDNDVSISIVTASNVGYELDKGDEDTLSSIGTDEMMLYAREGDVLGDLLDTLEMEGACCPPRRPAQPDDHPLSN